MGPQGPHADLPLFPDHVELIEEADEKHPFRLATSPARFFLNSPFTETQSSVRREERPEVMVHREDAAELGVADGALVTIGNSRGLVRLHARVTYDLPRGVLVSEGLWPNRAFIDGGGINVLTGADSITPFGGAAFHDNRVWLKQPSDQPASEGD